MIRMQEIGKIYPVRRGEPALPVLNGVNLQIRPGEYVAFVGPSGSGKSTLMHILGCLDAPSQGGYWLDGEDVSHLDARALCMVRREKIGFVFQGFQLLQKLTALENVAFPLMLRGVSEAERERRAMEALRRVGLLERARHKPGELSGGQQQRVAMARALCYSPKLLLCDEPTGALDEQSRDDILRMFEELHCAGHTVVVITHDPCVAARAMRRYRVEAGKVEECKK
ncbi:MAG: ABC transporter ATP-binding protein [Clostridia bacterium]